MQKGLFPTPPETGPLYITQEEPPGKIPEAL